jgi:hypothetical protein
VLDFDVVESAGERAADESIVTRIPTLPDPYDGKALAGKFSQPQIYVVETTCTKADGSTRKARLMVSVSSAEAGQPGGITDQRVNKGLVKFGLKGKLNFGKKADGVALKCEVALPAGMTLNQSQAVSVGIGNVTGSGTVDAKGKVSGLSGAALKKLQVKWPRLANGTTETKGGEKAKVTITLQGTSLDAAGFDTEGIVNTGLTDKVPVPRSIQTAIVLGGVSYYAQASVNYTLKKGTGMLQGRTEK